MIRAWSASTADAVALQLASEFAMVIALAVAVGLGAALWRESSTALRGLVVVGLVVWGASVLVPLWQLGHMNPALFEGRIGGTDRQRTTASSAGGSYVIEVGNAQADSTRPYLLQVRTARDVLKIRGDAGEPMGQRLTIPEGEELTLFLELGGSVRVQVRPEAPVWSWVRVGCLLAVLLALAGDALVRGPVVHLRGGWTLVITATALLVVLLDPAGEPDRRDVIAAAVGGILGAALLAVVWASAVGFARRRG